MTFGMNSVRLATVQTFGKAMLFSLVVACASMFSNLAQAADTASVVESYVAAWNEHDAAKAASFFSDDVSYYDASVGTPKKALKQRART